MKSKWPGAGARRGGGENDLATAISLHRSGHLVKAKRIYQDILAANPGVGVEMPVTLTLDDESLFLEVSADAIAKVALQLNAIFARRPAATARPLQLCAQRL